MEPTIEPGSNQHASRSMVIAATILFVLISILWLFIHPFNADRAVFSKHIWSASYELISILGSIFGLIISSYWQGPKSVIGRAILAFSIGLFLQSFGQTIYNYYTLFARIETPYPSLGDIGYFGSVIAYIYGAFVLTKATGMKFTIHSLRNRLLLIALPFGLLLISYFIFLRGYVYSGSPLTTFFDFGYPLGQVIYVSIALLAVYMSFNYLGGILKRPIALLLAALIVQYICDFNFLLQANHSLWYAGNIGDYLYAVSYFLMTLALVNMGYVRMKLNKTYDGNK